MCKRLKEDVREINLKLTLSFEIEEGDRVR